MRAPVYLLLGLLGCSCSTAPIETCGDSIPRLTRRGLTVISDIDDTIKDTRVKLGRSHAMNPAILFDGLRTWHPVPGMADLYRQAWQFREQARCKRPAAGKRATIIYLSAGPCRYSKRLHRDIPKWDFPAGPIMLRRGGLFPPAAYKTEAITRILELFPKRHFVLIGDSGEHDPESYGKIARIFPNQIDAIYIRVISSDACSRYERAFCHVTKSKIHFLRADLRTR